jgi:hypothetical protein
MGPGVADGGSGDNADTGGAAGPGLTGTGNNTGTKQPHKETTSGLNLGNSYKQCSISRSAASTMTVTEIKNGVCVTSATGAPKIGGLDWPDDDLVLKTFHGARISKNSRTVIECVSCSFDPRNLTCLGCLEPHHILNSSKRTVLAFTDQSFVPFLSGGGGGGLRRGIESGKCISKRTC